MYHCTRIKRGDEIDVSPGKSDGLLPLRRILSKAKLERASEIWPTWAYCTSGDWWAPLSELIRYSVLLPVSRTNRHAECRRRNRSMVPISVTQSSTKGDSDVANFSCIPMFSLSVTFANVHELLSDYCGRQDKSLRLQPRFTDVHLLLRSLSLNPSRNHSSGQINTGQ